MQSKKKKCCHCKKEKSLSAFCKDGNRVDGIHYTCKVCRSKMSRESYRKNGGKKDRDKHLRRTYGITLSDYNAILVKQRGVCEICGSPEKTKSLAVDHDHKTGKVRGLLCLQCNTLLGRIERNPNLISNILEYLKK